MTKAPFELIPCEVFYKIVKRCTVKSHKYLSSTCKRFSLYIKDEKYWKYRCSQDYLITDEHISYHEIYKRMCKFTNMDSTMHLRGYGQWLDPYDSSKYEQFATGKFTGRRFSFSGYTINYRKWYYTLTGEIKENLTVTATKDIQNQEGKIVYSLQIDLDSGTLKGSMILEQTHISYKGHSEFILYSNIKDISS